MKMIIIVLLVASVAALEESDTKISTTRNAYRTSICDYYSATFTNTEK